MLYNEISEVQRGNKMTYDFIGDIHGYINPLRSLLKKLNYHQEDENLWIPPEGHKAVLVGDYIDRGNDSLAVLKTVKAMVESGYAVALLGNHEYNAICYHTEDGKGGYLRSHSVDHNRQHQATIDDFKKNNEKFVPWIDWFKTLPLFFETDDFIAIHACPEMNILNKF